MNLLETFTYIFEGDASRLDKTLTDSDKRSKDLKGSLDKADASASVLAEGFLGLTSGILAGAAAFLSFNAIAGLITSTVDSVDALGDQADALGIAVDQLESWDAAAARTGGQLGAFTQSIGAFNERVQEFARKGSVEMASMFKAAGLSLDEVKKSAADPIALLTEMASTFEKLSAAEALGLGKKLGLDAGTVNLLREGKEGLAAVIAQQRELGIITAADTEAAGKFNDTLDDARRVFDTIRRQLVIAVLPALTWLGERVISLGKFFQANSTIIAFGIGVIALAVTGVLLPAITSAATAAWALVAPFLPLVAVLALVGGAIALVAEDLYQFGQGNDSVTGALAKQWPIIGDAIRAVGAAAVVVIETFRLFGEAVGQALAGDAQGALDSFVDGLRELARNMLDQFPALQSFGEGITFVQGLLTDLFAVFDGAPDVVGNSFGKLSGLMKYLAASWNVAIGIIKTAFSSLAALITDGPTAALAALDRGLAEVFARFKTSFPQIASMLQGVGKFLGLGGPSIPAGAPALAGMGRGALSATAAAGVAGTSSAAVTAGGATNRTSTVQVDQVNVQTQATDADGISRAIGSSLKDHMTAAADQVDDGVAA